MDKSDIFNMAISTLIQMDETPKPTPMMTVEFIIHQRSLTAHICVKALT